MRSLRLLRPVEIALLGAFSLLIAMGSSQMPQAALANPAREGSIYIVKIDADPDTAGVQPCRSVAPEETFSIDFIIDSISASDSDNFASLGQVGVRFTTGDFTFSSNPIDFGPGVLDDVVGGFPSGIFGSNVDSLLANTTLIAKDYANFSITDASAVIGEVIIARITLTPVTDNSLLNVDVTQISNSSWDTYMGGAFGSLILPTTTQSIQVAVGSAQCPGDQNPPVADDDPNVTTPEETLVAIELTGSDIDGCDGGQTFTVTIVDEPSDGGLNGPSVVACNTGDLSATVSYTPDDEFNGADSFTFKFNDGTIGGGDSNTATVNIDVTAVNDAPEADAKVADVNENSNVDITLTGTDVDGCGGGQTFTFEVISGSGPSEGALDNTSGSASCNTGDLSATVNYDPDASPQGSDTFDYRFNDGTDNSNTASVDITINRRPVAVDDILSVDEGSIENILTVLANDTDPDNDTLLVTIPLGTPDNGTAIITGGGLTGPSITYTTPDEDFNGTVSAGGFAYTIKDPDVLTDSARVFLTVTAINDAPSFTKGADETVLEDAGAQTVAGWATNISAGPANESGQTLNFIVTNVNNALFAVQPAVAPDGTLTYTPADDANGTATVTVQVQDDGGTANGGVDTSDPQTFSINVTPDNDAPTCAGASVTVSENSTSAPFSLDCSDVENDTLICSVVSQGSKGTLNITDCDTATYSSTGGLGADSVTYMANDGNLDSDPAATVTVDVVVNQPPVADDKNVSVDEDPASPLDITLSASDVEGDCPLTFNVPGTTTQGGTLGAITGLTCTAGSASAMVTYDPAPDFNGPDSFTYTATDPSNTVSDPATVSITVNPINDAPSFTKGADETVLEDAGAQTVAGWATNISAGPANESGQTLNFIVANDNTALFAVQPAVAANGTLTYTPADDANGTANVTVQLQDNGGGDNTSAPQTFSINVTPDNDAPVANSVNMGTASKNSVDNAWTPDVSDIDAGDTLTCSIDTQPTNGNATVASDCSSGSSFSRVVFCSSGSYTPNTDFTGSDPFIYSVSDGKLSDTGTVSVNVVNDPPVANDVDMGTVSEDSTDNAWTPDVSDPNGDTLTCSIVSQPSNGTATVASDCSSGTYTPDAGFTGSDSFEYEAFDENEDSDTGKVSVVVNDPPVAKYVDMGSVQEDSKDNTWTPDVSDPNGDTLTCSIVSQPSNGTATVASDCSSATYTLQHRHRHRYRGRSAGRGRGGRGGRPDRTPCRRRPGPPGQRPARSVGDPRRVGHHGGRRFPRDPRRLAPVGAADTAVQEGVKSPATATR